MSDTLTPKESQGLAGGVLGLLRERDRLIAADNVSTEEYDDWYNMRDNLYLELRGLEPSESA